MLIFVDTLLVALSDPESLLQVSVQWWMVIDNYAEEPFLPEVIKQRIGTILTMML